MKRKKRSKKLNINQVIFSLIIFLIVVLLSYYFEKNEHNQNVVQNSIDTIAKTTYSNLENIPEYSGEICVKINDNIPYFSEADYTTNVFENYSELDVLGRCGVAFVNVCKEIMPPEGDKRGDIRSVYPTGWKQSKFNGEYLYNRCHLIAYSLSDEDDNKQNLITGTRYFNVQGMLPIERLVLEYINKNKDNHVLYRVTPVFKGNNLLASGVEMEAYSVEDNGEGLCFNVFVYNVQPGANLDYATGKLLEI